MKSPLAAVIASIPLALLSGVASLGTVSFAQDDDELPDRASLLERDDTTCNGVLIIESDVDDDEDDVRRVRRGQSRVLEVDNENVSGHAPRRACATSMSARGETNLGERCRVAFGDGYAIGFSTDHVAAAGGWDEPARITVRPAWRPISASTGRSTSATRRCRARARSGRAVRSGPCLPSCCPSCCPSRRRA